MFSLYIMNACLFNIILNIIIIYFIYDDLEKMLTKNLTNALTACILDSSGVGFVKYFKSKHLFQKLLWILFIIASFLICGYFIYLNIQNYLNFSYITHNIN